MARYFGGTERKLNPNIDLWVNNEYSNNNNRNNFTEHTFRLSKIHKWITKWSDTKLIHPNAWSSLFIGTSAFLESIVAKMRSKILDEKRLRVQSSLMGEEKSLTSLPNLENMKKGGWKDNYKTF